ncbi:MAG TPA: hypothetical protein VF126_12455 [Acidobacteriaceae bacterium]
MRFSDANQPPAPEYTERIDSTLAALSVVQPRAGLEQRVLAHLSSAPELSWYQRWITIPIGHHRWAVAAASAVVVAGGVTIGSYRHHPAAQPAPVAVHMPRPAQQPAATAAGVGVSDHPLDTHKVKTHHRGVRRSYRAMHDRVPLPRGTAVPLRPQIVPPSE